MYLPKGKYCVYPRMVCKLVIVMPPPPPQIHIPHSHWGPRLQEKKLCIDLKWREMRSKVIFDHPKWPPAAILWTNSKKLKLCIDLKWRKLRSKVIFGNPKWPVCKLFGDIHSICPWAITPILVFLGYRQYCLYNLYYESYMYIFTHMSGW